MTELEVLMMNELEVLKNAYEEATEQQKAAFRDWLRTIVAPKDEKLPEMPDQTETAENQA